MKRKGRGNMLVLSGVFVSVNAVALVVASSFGSLFFVHNRLQSTADELALAGTSMLNSQDRIGQMNNMLARSRQMVYDADSSNTQAQSSLNQLSAITDQLHAEAREGAMLLEQERLKLSNVCTQDATTLVTSQFTALKAGHTLQLPWLQVAEPTMQISFGRITAVQSNVNELPGIQALDAADKASYIANDGSNLYKFNVNAKLSGNDSDLPFKITSLPALVQTSISPARAVLAKSYIPANDDNISSAVQVTLKLDVATEMGASAKSSLESIGSAVTTGGQAMAGSP